MAYTQATPPPVEVFDSPYVPYMLPNGGTAPPYAPYIPPYTPPPSPPIGETVPPYIPPALGVMPPVADPRDSRGGGGRSPEEQQRVNNYFDRMTPEQKQAHAESLRTGVNFVTALMPGAWIPKAVDYVKGFYAEQQYKNVMAKEAAENEAARMKSETTKK